MQSRLQSAQTMRVPTENLPMTQPSPALSAARRAVIATGARSIMPVIGGALPADPAGGVLLVEEPPSGERLAQLRRALDRASAIVIWAAGWDQDRALAALGEHGFDFGSIDILAGAEAGMLAVLVRDAETAHRLAAVPFTRFRALAIMPAFNEADVIYHAIGALVAGGVDVYLIDHESTDGTAEAAAPWLGRGLVRIERFPEEAGYGERNHGVMVWREILRRVQEVSGEVSADWYLFVNADEFREAPWPGMTLAEGLREVDELGYSAVNFDLFNFRPTDDSFRPGDDPRGQLRYYEPPGRHDLLQVKAWKRQSQVVDLVHHGGHDVLFEGKRVFPVPFILRHYPIRSSDHGIRKVLGERLPRFAAEERADGWHVQYDHYSQGANYLHDPAELSEWDDDRVRASLFAECTRRLVLTDALAAVDRAGCEPDAGRLAAWLGRRAGGGISYDDLVVVRDRLQLALRSSPSEEDAVIDARACDLAIAFEAQAWLRADMVTVSALADARARLSTPPTPELAVAGARQATTPA